MSVEPHKHCPVCGTPIPMDEKTCSPDCDLIITQQQKQIKRNQKIMGKLNFTVRPRTAATLLSDAGVQYEAV